jgi:D-glycero-alpha-D-manno-heptose-7-phosphate kinase
VNLDELERRVMVCYTGKPRQHGINNWEVFKAQIGGKSAVQKSLERISEVAQEMRVALEKPDWDEAGRLMREEWSFRKRNLPTISTKTIDRVIENARRNGALAGKVCGAGGGGCVVLLVEPHARERVEQSIREAGAQVLPMSIDRQGVQVISR